MYIRTNIHGYRLIKYLKKKNIYIYIYTHTHTHTYIFSVYYTFSKIIKREVPLQNTLYIKHIHENTL